MIPDIMKKMIMDNVNIPENKVIITGVYHYIKPGDYQPQPSYRYLYHDYSTSPCSKGVKSVKVKVGETIYDIKNSSGDPTSAWKNDPSIPTGDYEVTIELKDNTCVLYQMFDIKKDDYLGYYTSIKISGTYINPSNPARLACLCVNRKNLEVLDMSEFQCPYIEEIYGMINNCPKLSTLYMGSSLVKWVKGNEIKPTVNSGNIQGVFISPIGPNFKIYFYPEPGGNLYDWYPHKNTSGRPNRIHQHNAYWGFPEIGTILEIPKSISAGIIEW